MLGRVWLRLLEWAMPLWDKGLGRRTGVQMMMNNISQTMGVGTGHELQNRPPPLILAPFLMIVTKSWSLLKMGLCFHVSVIALCFYLPTSI